jgi:Neutral/alkaline non-lysosomal ceramidase, N-terminal
MDRTKQEQAMNRCQVLATFLAAFLVLAAKAPAAEPLQAGVAVVDITPPLGYRMAGYYSERRNTGTHDPLLAKAVVFQQGSVQAAFVECDLVSIPAEVSAKARALAEKGTGIPSRHMVVSATHSHTGPLFTGPLRKLWSEQAIARDGKDPTEAFDYPAALIERVAQAIEQAAKNARPTTLSAGVGEQTGLSFNRRFHMKDGTVRFNPGRRNPDIVRPAGPLDPAVSVLLFTDAATARPLASITNFAMHLDTIGGTEYAADYPLYVERQLRQKLGDDFVSLFATGTCGDINHIDVNGDNPLKGHAEAERIGTTLGNTVVATLPKLVEQRQVSLAVRQKLIEVPAQQFSNNETTKAKERMHKIGGRELTFLEQVETNKIVDVSQRYGSGKVPLEVVAIRLSPDVAIVTLPGEVFVELGLAIKQASPFKTTLVVELSNDAPAYIPTKKAFAEGSYEIVNSRVASGGGEKLTELAISLLKELAP